jgi:hypothetical protein
VHHISRKAVSGYKVKKERNILHKIKRRKANWIGHILRRNCLLKHVIEGKLEVRIEMTGRRGRRRKQLLEDLQEKNRYYKLKEEALDLTLWRTRFGRGYGPVVNTDYGMNESLGIDRVPARAQQAAAHLASTAQVTKINRPRAPNIRVQCKYRAT